VYAAGCVLFELLTGEPPFTGDTPVAVAYQHVREEPRRPSEVNPSIPSALDAVVLKALSKNPLNRYQSAAEMRSDLVRVRNGQNPMAPLVMSEDERTAMMAPPAHEAPTRRLNGRHTMPPPADDYDYYDEEPRRSTGKTIGIVAAVLVALGLVGFVAYQVLIAGSPAPRVVQVPAVTGLAQTDATNQLVAAGLRLGSVAEEESSVQDRGNVIRTDPPVGSEVEERSTVNLVVGSGPASVNVPRLEGKTLQEAQTLLQDEGLELGAQTQQETPDSSQVGKVLASTPRAGEAVEGGSTVAVVIGSEQTTVPVPDVSGQDIDDAEQALRQAGLSPRRQDDSSDDNERVSGTNPAAGQRVAKGSEVILLTGDGEEVEMPDLEDQTEEQAVDRLRGLGLTKIQIRQETTTNDDLDGRVLEQSPRPGEKVGPDDQITLTVGDAPGVFG
jgi:beta-lactam-binding protein with PASTA domain